MDTVAVFGASGFIGTTFVEHLMREGKYQVWPFINSGKNAWRLARLGLDLERADVLDDTNLVRALEGCTHVVNSIMGPQKVMFDGLKNLLAACQTVGVKRFVHLSSITAYGEPPPPDSVYEEAQPNPQRGTYGWIKMNQDNMVLKAAEEGLPCIVLCPPIVSGPRSTQLMWLLNTINEHRFAQVEGGKHPCAVVDVDNLAHAMVLALDAPDPDGKRIFILDDIVPTWSALLEGMVPLFEPGVAYPDISRAEAERLMKQKDKVRLSPVGTLKHLMSPKVRQVLTHDPLIRSISRTVKQILPDSTVKAIRQKGKVPKVRKTAKPKPSYDTLQLARQLRGVFHSGERAKAKLGYTPLYSFDESMVRFRNWYMDEKGWTSEHADLIKELEH